MNVVELQLEYLGTKLGRSHVEEGDMWNEREEGNGWGNGIRVALKEEDHFVWCEACVRVIVYCMLL